VLKKTGLVSRSSFAFCQWLPASSGGDASRWTTGQPDGTRSAIVSPPGAGSVTVITFSLPRPGAGHDPEHKLSSVQYRA
jgi:hypothetical protein